MRSLRYFLAAPVAALLLAGPAQAKEPGAYGTPWTDFPLLLPERDDGRMTGRLRPANWRLEAAVVYPPFDGAAGARAAVDGRTEVTLQEGRFSFRPTSMKVGGYHWVAASRDEGDRVVTASTVKYFSNPGPAPRGLLKLAKSELEVVPDPLPREHSHYREDEAWAFQLRFKGRPLANQPVVLETENGTRRELVTGTDGRVTVTFPEDIPQPEAAAHQGHGHPRTPESAFVLGAEFMDDQGRTHISAFNGSYEWGAYRDRSLMSGLGFGLVGMALATPLLRRRKGAKA